MAFSTITIDESTSTPMEIAMPASHMMFDGIRSPRIRMNDTSTAIGSVIHTISALRKCHKTSRIARLATIISSRSVPVTVSMAPLDERRAVVERHDAHAFGQAGLELLGSSP